MIVEPTAKDKPEFEDHSNGSDQSTQVEPPSKKQLSDTEVIVTDTNVFSVQEHSLIKW